MDSAMDISVPSGTELSPDSTARVIAMCRTRRERVLAEEEVHAQSVQLNDESAQFLTTLVNGLQEEESTMRMNILKAEERASNIFVRQMEESSKAFEQQLELLQLRKNVEKAKARKMKQLQDELAEARFRAFWSQKKVKSETTVHVNEQAALWNRVTPLMAKAYEYSAPPFACDPEDLWRRGVAVPPDLQSSVMQGNTSSMHDPATAKLLSELALPAYHDFGMKMRAKYQGFVAQNGAPEVRIQTDSELSPVRIGTKPGAAMSPTPGQAAAVSGSVSRERNRAADTMESPGMMMPARRHSMSNVAAVHSSPYTSFIRGSMNTPNVSFDDSYRSAQRSPHTPMTPMSGTRL